MITCSPVIFRASLRVLALLVVSASAFSQQYVISTIAGGAPPVTPGPALSASIRTPDALAVDTSGNLYIATLNCVLKVDASGKMTRVAGNARGGFSGDTVPAASAQLNNPASLA